MQTGSLQPRTSPDALEPPHAGAPADGPRLVSSADPVALRIRAATVRDHAAMCALFDELDQLHRDARPDHFQPFDGPARSRELVDALISDPASTILVAQTMEGLAGLVVVKSRTPSEFAGAAPRRVFEIDNIVVQGELRNRRVGRRLLSAAVEWARTRRATHIEVAVHDFNRDAQRFYVGFGFTPSVHRLVMAA